MRRAATQIFTLVVLALTTNAPAFGRQAPDDAAAVFDRANEKFQQADALVDSDPQGARALYLESATLFGQCINQFDIDNAMLHVNHGNALLRAGEVGRAVAAYRRAERLRPNDERAQAGLRAARAFTATEVEPDAWQRAADAMLWWRAYAPRGALFTIGVVAYVFAWGLAIVRVVTSWRPSRTWIALAGSLATILLGSLALEEALVFDSSHGVVIASEVVGRNGPDSAAYEATFTAPLNSGVEVTVLETRPGWMHVQLRDGRRTWLPSEAVEVI